MICGNDCKFWKKTLMKGFVMAGTTFFAVVVSIGAQAALEPTLVAAGTYIFMEASKYYNLTPLSKRGGYKFLI